MNQNKLSSQDLYNLASKNNVYIVEENLGNQIAGYTNNTFDKKLIHVNSKISRYYKKIVIAYFLPHYTNKCTQDENLSILTIKKVMNKDEFLLYEREAI